MERIITACVRQIHRRAPMSRVAHDHCLSRCGGFYSTVPQNRPVTANIREHSPTVSTRKGPRVEGTTLATSAPAPNEETAVLEGELARRLSAHRASPTASARRAPNAACPVRHRPGAHRRL